MPSPDQVYVSVVEPTVAEASRPARSYVYVVAPALSSLPVASYV